MRILDKVLSLFKSRQVDPPPTPVNIVSIPITDHQPQSFLSPFNLAVIRLRANAISTLQWNVYNEQGNQRVLVDPNKHPIARVFWRPAKNLTTTELLSNIVFFLDVFGNAFVRVKKKNGDFEMSLLHPALIQVDNVSYTMQDERIPREEVIHIREPIFDWLNRKSNIAILPRTYLWSANIVLNALMNFVARFAEKNGVPPIYFSGATLSPEQQARVVQQWNALYPDYPLRTFIESGRIESIPISLSFNIDALPDVMRVPMQTIASFYGVPLGKITGENANYATAMINDYTFWTTSVKPTALLIQDALTDYFRQFDETILITFEDVDFSAFEMFKQAPNKTTIQTKQTPSYDLFYQWKSLDRFAKDLAKSFEQPFKLFWESFNAYVLQKTQQKAFVDVSLQIRPDDVIEILQQYIAEPLSTARKKAIRRAFQELGENIPSVGYEVINAKVSEFQEQQLAQWVQNWTKQLQQQIETSENPEDLQLKIEKFFSKITEYRLSLQARQLATATLNVSLTETFSYFPEYDVAWLSQRDEKVRPAHILADGQIRKNGYFSVGGELLPFPGGGVLPENNINCRCYVRPVRRQ